ncbi:MAG TPA: rRNA maturation RNase YbeY [candidate division Zixibacteria bacterium]|nr:rRNA maturation RNase YbeY [candidate division Zixibacteria bacterium]MDD4916934.1 rRNA maturation RNase YbeY [candidate division Zixibacteria bacterium]MDM7973067.1 rRNA maturation RNase YbeY [candidate division Zixibacteria bacterium]HOD66815.1 rRNA maturation RNase YbeY [candidate division Zixibacteria bacterium]HPI33258.1 rRNA maturation RNase YbeY [candidate division Zixibacteria bacterium]
MKLRIYKETTVRVPRARLERLFRAVARGERRKAGEVNLVFTGGRRMRRLNRTYRGRDKATDVLAFPLHEGAGEQADEIYGEVYIAVPVARAQAAAYGVGLGEEILRLACHGWLHLFGYDHHTPAEAAAMRTREERYLAAVRGA